MTVVSEDLLGMAVQLLSTRMREQQQTDSTRVRHGTIQDTQAGGIGIHDVVIDGDDDPIGAHDVTMGFPLVPGDRVTVLFAAPHQALIIGKVPFHEAGNLITINEFTPTWQTTTIAGVNTAITYDIAGGGSRYGAYVDLFGFILGIAGFKLGPAGGISVNGSLTLVLPTLLHPSFVPSTAGSWIGAGRMFDASAGTFWSCTAQVGRPFAVEDLLFNFGTAGAAAWNRTIPVTWAAGDGMSVLFIYPREPG